MNQNKIEELKKTLINHNDEENEEDKTQYVIDEASKEDSSKTHVNISDENIGLGYPINVLSKTINKRIAKSYDQSCQNSLNMK